MAADGPLAAAQEDLRLGHVEMPDWRRGTHQPLLSTEYVLVEPMTKIEKVPNQVDFELPKKHAFLFGPMSKFRIKGTFQKLAENAAEWANVPAADHSTVLLAPLWLEMLIREASCFHNNYRIASSNENRYTAPYVNAYLHHNMDKLSKKLLCPQACHPGYGLPAPDGEWKYDATAWVNYSKTVFTGAAISFDYIPLFFFPFFQGSSFMIDESVPRILPAPHMGKIQIRFNFTDSQEHIFRKKDTNKAKYRFAFSEFSLVLEEAKLSPTLDRFFKTTRRPMAFPGVTRIQLLEPVTAASSTWKAKFQDIYLPEALFVFCLDKAVANGTFKFSTATNTKVFSDHNIESIDLWFDGKRFALGEPNLGTFCKDEMDSKILYDHLATPPFGIRQDPDHVTAANVANGSVNTPFPHVYISLVGGPNRQRIVPAMDEGDCINKRADLDVELKFTETNSPQNVVFAVYAIYTDVNVVFDPKNRNFSSPYLQYIN